MSQAEPYGAGAGPWKEVASGRRSFGQPQNFHRCLMGAITEDQVGCSIPEDTTGDR